VILAGDYNVMPTDLDVYKPERWEGDALFRPEVNRWNGLLGLELIIDYWTASEPLPPLDADVGRIDAAFCRSA